LQGAGQASNEAQEAARLDSWPPMRMYESYTDYDNRNG